MADVASCIATAQQVGFPPAGAQRMCGYFQRESHFDPNVPCTCSSEANKDNPAGWIHGYDACKAANLDPHCGFGQWSHDIWGNAYQPGCLGDLTCELQYALLVTDGGTCFQPWSYGDNCTPRSNPPFSGTGSGQALQSGGGSGSGGKECTPESGFCASDIGGYSQPWPWAGPCPFMARQATTCDFWGGSPSQNTPIGSGKCGPLDVQCMLKSGGPTVAVGAAGLLLILVGVLAISHSR